MIAKNGVPCLALECLACCLVLLIVAPAGHSEAQTEGPVPALSAEVRARVLQICETRFQNVLRFYRERLDGSADEEFLDEVNRNARLPITASDEEILLDAGQRLLAQPVKDWEIIFRIAGALSNVPTNTRVVQFMSRILHQEVRRPPETYELGAYIQAISALAAQGTDEALQVVYETAILAVHQTPGLLVHSGAPEDAAKFRLQMARNGWSSIRNCVRRDLVLPLMKKVAEQYPLDSELRPEVAFNLWAAERIEAGLRWKSVSDYGGPAAPDNPHKKDDLR
ncbi:MAG: hypothetical protein IT365_28240 [Candidatus Hydrogenedentes bacterium]|nr:hypothetical protein [Candidatus Hydrogenedentota bacterium]